MRNKGFIERILPLFVNKIATGKYAVYTNGNFIVGARLLKGISPPNVDSFGPFQTREEAEQLAIVLERHIRDEWPDRSRYKSKKARKDKGLE